MRSRSTRRSGSASFSWHWAAQYAPSGDIGRFDDGDIADGVHWDGDPEKLVRALVAAGLLDEHREHRLLVHDWPEHADDAVNMSLARRFDRFADGRLPKLSRFTKRERQRIEPHYKAHGEHTADAPPSPPLPSPPPPSQQQQPTPTPCAHRAHTGDAAPAAAAADACAGEGDPSVVEALTAAKIGGTTRRELARLPGSPPRSSNRNTRRGRATANGSGRS